MTFTGHNRADVKRKVLAYWAANTARLGMDLRQFLQCCRLDPSQNRITFVRPG